MSPEKLKNTVENDGISAEGAQRMGAGAVEAAILDMEPSEESAKALEYAESLADDEILDGDFDAEKLTRTADDFHTDYHDYQILRCHAEREYIPREKKIVSVHRNMDYIASRYVGYTDDLIQKICGQEKALTDVEHDRFQNKENLKLMKADHLIYLDKSGRPASWLVNTFWDDFAPKGEDGKPMPRPDHSYVNVDRLSVLGQLFNIRVENQNMAWKLWEENKDKVKLEHLAQLRSMFLEESLDPENPPTPKEIMQMPTKLDGKKVMIIDEVLYGGTTLRIAETLFKKAFPDAKFSEAVFWQDSTKVATPDDGGDAFTYLSALPAWYRHENDYYQGRGIGDVEPSYFEAKYAKSDELVDEALASSSAQHSPEEIAAIKETARKRRFTQAYGANFRSRPIDLRSVALGDEMEGEDKNGQSRRLMQDFNQLHKDYLAHKILPFVSPKDRNSSQKAADRWYIRFVKAGISPKNFTKVRKEVDERPPEVY